jgi:hypothetical protein
VTCYFAGRVNDLLLTDPPGGEVQLAVMMWHSLDQMPRSPSKHLANKKRHWYFKNSQHVGMSTTALMAIIAASFFMGICTYRYCFWQSSMEFQHVSMEGL